MDEVKQFTKEEILDFFKVLSDSNSDGIEILFSEVGKKEVFERLKNIDNEPLNKVQLNQLFILSGLPGFTFGFFKYYWLAKPEKHPYKVDLLDDYEKEFIGKQEIISLKHLRWGLTRVYIDALLFYGNISNGFKHISVKKYETIEKYFEGKCFPIETITARGHSLKFIDIPKEDRYLISEMACKTYEAPSESESDLKQFLIENYTEAIKQGRKRILVKDLFSKEFKSSSRDKYEGNLFQLEFSAEDILEQTINTEEDIEKYYSDIATRFKSAREQAMQNTKLYLSLVNDLDVYVATSMRKKQDFLEMADNCVAIFKHRKILPLNLRYFDPTISAADGHEDKGLIECLMVRCAKVLVYSAGVKESYGKDAEAAMALSSGKPVIFFCIDSNKADFYKKVHPLTKLIDFGTGVANGAMITFQVGEVVELLHRIFNNNMQYKIEQPKKGYFRLVELSTDSAVRIQTNNELLSKSFWNYFDRFLKVD
ncbi:MAG: hypothetical protein ACYC09_04490 [Bacteroidota bacterium]